MLHRKIYQICSEGRQVSVFLRDQQRWIEEAKIVDLEGDVVTIRYEEVEDDEISTWEEIVRLESIGTITQKIASVSRTASEIPITEDCHEAERINPKAAKFPVTEDPSETGAVRPNAPDLPVSEESSLEDYSESPSTTEQIFPNSPDTTEK